MTRSITWTTPLVAWISTKDVTILLILLFASVKVKALASAVMGPPKVPTCPLVNWLDWTFAFTIWFNKTASTVAVSISVSALTSSSANKAPNASFVGANTVNGPAAASETVAIYGTVGSPVSA